VTAAASRKRDVLPLPKKNLHAAEPAEITSRRHKFFSGLLRLRPS